MSASMRMDNREFTDTLRKVAANSSRELSVVINSRMLAIAKTAAAKTPVASRAEIQTALGATIKSERVNKKGRTVRRYNYSPTPLVYALVNARRRKAGQAPIARGEMADAAKKLISGRLRAIGSLRSGWKRAIGKLAFAVKQSAPSEGPNVKQASTAVIAQPGWNPKAEVEYRVVVDHGNGKQIDPRVVTALETGFAVEQGEMLRHLEEKVTKAARDAGAIK